MYKKKNPANQLTLKQSNFNKQKSDCVKSVPTSKI